MTRAGNPATGPRGVAAGAGTGGRFGPAAPAAPAQKPPGPRGPSAAPAAVAPRSPARVVLAPEDEDERINRIAKWSLGGYGLGVVISIVTHLLLMMAAGFVYFGYGPGIGDSGAGSEGIEMSIVDEAPGVETPDVALDAGTPIASEASEPLPDAALSAPSDLSGPAGLGPGSSEDLGDAAAKLGGAGGGGNEEGLGKIGGSGGGGGGSKFFGVEAQGSRFAYIVDVSGSMQGIKIAQLKQNLQETIGGLLEHMSFVVMCFSSDKQALGGRERWTSANDAAKKWAKVKIDEINANGGTNPQSSFEAIFALTPRPDAIYFMTDGQFDPTVADTIAFLNRTGKKVPVHCITFGDRSAEELMRRIASESGGTYTHVEAPK